MSSQGVPAGGAGSTVNELGGTMNRLQRHLRALSDEHLDDTAIGLSACERARIALDITKRALIDGCITSSEALEILEAQKAVIEASDLSLACDVSQQPQLDEFILPGEPVPGAYRISGTSA